MANLDLTSLLYDPDFADVLLVKRNVQTVGSDGLAVNVATATRFSAVVTAGKGTSLRRFPEGAQVSGDIQLFTTFVLRDGRTALDADVVTWDTRQYTVVHVDPWTNWGPGFIVATCELISPSGG